MSKPDSAYEREKRAATRERIELGDDEEGRMTFERIAEVLTARGVPMTRANCWMIHNKALRKIRAALEVYL